MDWVSRLREESGFATLVGSCRDVKILCLQRMIRMFAFGISFLVLVDFLSMKGLMDSQIGVFMTLTLLGDVVISLVLTSITDQVGRRRVLAAGSALMAGSGILFAFSSNYLVLMVASICGVISPTGNEIGPFRAIEESILAQLTEKSRHSDIFAWNLLLGSAGAGLGALVSGLAVQWLQGPDESFKMFAYKVIFIAYAAAGVAKLILSLLLSRSVEVHHSKLSAREVDAETQEALLSDADSDTGITLEEVQQRPARPKTSQPASRTSSILSRFRGLLPYISPASRATLYRLVTLFFMDSFASGMATPSWITYFFTTVHSIQPSMLGTLFLVTSICQTVSNLLAVPLAKRLGLLKTMVFTHLPSTIFLALIPLPATSPSGTWLAMAFLALRACTSSLDQAPRQAFLSAAVLPAERTAVMGFVNTVKTLAQSGGIGVAGKLAQEQWWIALFGGAGLLKMSYDLLLLWVFLGVKSRNETPSQT